MDIVPIAIKSDVFVEAFDIDALRLNVNGNLVVGLNELVVLNFS